MPVRLVHETASKSTYYGVNLSGKGRVGVLTAYCINANNAKLCPNRVDAALGRSASVSSEAANEVRVVGLSYESLEGETIAQAEVEEF
ncbi:MAG: hypothetical protein ACTHZ5_04435 [Micrococcaceae bacterium]